MKTTWKIEIIGLGLALAMAPLSSASADAPAKKARAGFSAAEGVAQAYAEQRAKAARPERLVQKFEVKATLRVVAQLARFEDGVALLATSVTDKRAAALLRMGAREVERASEARSHTVFEGRYYRAYGAFDVEPAVLEGLVGQRVAVELVRTSDGRLRITQIRRAS